MKRKATDHNSNIETNSNETQSISKIYKDRSFWYFLRRFKKKLRVSYANDIQSAYAKGFKEGKECPEVRALSKQQWQQGHAQGMYNALTRVDDPSRTMTPSSYAPSFVISLLKELQVEFDSLKKSKAIYHNQLSSALKEGTFKVKKVHGSINIAVTSIFNIVPGRRKRKRKQFENEISEIENLKTQKAI
eukprot:TRINITY_DN175_c1_g1_i1.p1 TRINITY_DN175_c1_g1~~TRINITY_DN175_c1_g1_i1.p1  ORF type:complete len:189 (+),score=33.56 TRINITY_DN175_c1_g1_i1:175-741(+)